MRHAQQQFPLMTLQEQQEMQQQQQQQWQRQQQMPPPRLPTICTREEVQKEAPGKKLGQKAANAVAEYFREKLNIDVASTQSRTCRTLPMVLEDLARKWPKDRTSVTVLVPR